MITRVLNIILATVVLFSSTGFIVSNHYCQNELKGTSLFIPVEGCDDMPVKTSCSSDKNSCSNHTGDDGNCCDNERTYYKLDQDQQVQTFELNNLLKNPVLLSVIFVALNIDFPTVDKQTRHFLTYKPPIVSKDIPLLLQTFLL